MKFLKWVCILLVAVPLVLMAGFYIRNKAVGPEGWAEDNTIRTLKTMMKDPDSMVIRSSFIVRNSKRSGGTEIAFCGLVDGKNGFGALTGGTPFMSVSQDSGEAFDTYIVKMEDPEQKQQADSLGKLSAFETVYWNESCVDSTHPAIVSAKGR